MFLFCHTAIVTVHLQPKTESKHDTQCRVVFTILALVCLRLFTETQSRTYTLLSVIDMESSVRASLEISLSLALVVGAKVQPEATWYGLAGSQRLYDLDRHKRHVNMLLFQEHSMVPF